MDSQTHSSRRPLLVSCAAVSALCLMPTLCCCRCLSFHCDEALACFLLRQTAAYQSAPVIRSRDPAVLSRLPIIVDVGAVYDAASSRFDHHQRGFEETFSPSHLIKLSSAGLIYRHFGQEVIARLTGCTEAESVSVLWQRLYQTFIEAIDAIDNGVSQYDSSQPPRYRITTDLSSRVSRLNGGGWDDDGEPQDARFERAAALTGREFTEALVFLHRQWLPARQTVRRMIERRFDVHASGCILRMDAFVSWKSQLLQLEQEMLTDDQQPLLYLLYQDDKGNWRVQCVPSGEDSFESRKPLPEAWRGVRDDALAALSGIPGAVFVHAAGFIGGAETYEAALAMAVAAWEMPGQVKAGKRQKREDDSSS